MPANGRRDLIRRLKVKGIVNILYFVCVLNVLTYNLVKLIESALSSATEKVEEI